MALVFDPDAEGGDFERIHFVQDAASGLQAIVAVHSTRRGPAFGGIRRITYPSEAAAVEDVRRLAHGMSLKLALAELPAGGAKAVMLDHAGLDVAAAYRALGQYVADMDGRYVCGPDVGTGERELDHVRERTRWVNPKGNDANASTAAGVMAGLHGTLEALGRSLAGTTFLVQGLGGVGGTVARTLLDAGGDVLGCDVDPDAQHQARAKGIDIVDPQDAMRTPCDVFVPCALGGILTEATAARLPAVAVCGSANNQLATPRAGHVLWERGILYAPDFAVNVGAVAEGVHTTRDGASEKARQDARRAIAGVQQTVKRIFEAAEDENLPPVDVALRMARARLAP